MFREVTVTNGIVQPATTDVNPSGRPASDGDGRRTRWAAHREQRRAELIGAAIEAIVRYGPDLDMAQVATVAGVSKPVLYRYFADKTQLWLAVGEHLAQIVYDAVVPAIDRVREERELVAATIDAYLRTIETMPDLYRVLTHQTDVAGVHHLIRRSAQTVAASLARVIGDRLRALGLDSGPAEPWGYGIVGMVQSVGDWWMLHERPMSRAALTDYLTTLLWQGIAGIKAAADIPGGIGVPT
jgi:AcrR family transcriptional regulator